MRGTLNNLIRDRIKTLADYRAMRSERSAVRNNLSQNVQKSAFNNYEDTNKVDYDEIEERLFELMLNG